MTGLFLGMALLSALPTQSASAGDAAATSPELSSSICAECPFVYGWSGDAALGLTGVSGADYAYGKYSGYYHKGMYLAADGNAAYRDKDGRYLSLSGGNLGLDSRFIDLQGGRQGEYELRAQYRQTPQFLYDTGQTPYLGAGTSHENLPSNWVPGGSTAQMSPLPAALHPVGISSQRRTFDLGADITPRASHWDFVFNVRHDLQTGNGITGANFLTNSAQLVQPIDYSTDQVEASVAYTQATWQIRGGYYGSFFNDGNDSLQWTNPFVPLAPGATQGQMSQAPGNAFNQFSLAGGWQLLPMTRLTASLAYGRQTQDASFIPYTINPTLITAPLPAANLNGIVDVGNYIVRLTSSPVRHLSVTAEYLDNRRDNSTPQYVYQQVVSDTFVGGEQMNLPYSYDRKLGKLMAAFRFSPQLKLSAGLQDEHYDRTFDATLKTTTNSSWAEINSSFGSGVDFSAKYTHSERQLDSYQLLVPLAAANNPLLRDFDVANRTRDQWQATVSYALRADFGLDLVLQQNRDKYPYSSIGLTADKDNSMTLDANWRPRDKITVDAFATREFIRSDQAGSQSFTVPDWTGSNNAVVDTIGLSGQWRDAAPGFDLGTSYTFSYSRQRIAVETGTAETPFPNNTVNYAMLSLWSRYHIGPRSTLRFQYAYERMNSVDWALDGVEYDTVPNVLLLGVASPRYQVNVLAISYQYVF